MEVLGVMATRYEKAVLYEKKKDDKELKRSVEKLARFKSSEQKFARNGTKITRNKFAQVADVDGSWSMTASFRLNKGRI